MIYFTVVFGFKSTTAKVYATLDGQTSAHPWKCVRHGPQLRGNPQVAQHPWRTMPSLHHGAIFIGVFLIATGGATAFLASEKTTNHAFSLCCVVLGALLLILGLFWAMNGKNNQVPYGDDYSHVLFTPPPGSHFPESQSVLLQRTLERQRCGIYGEDFDYPPLEPTCFSPPMNPSCWNMEAPPPYEVAIRTTRSSTHLQRSYSDTLLATEPLFSRSREISFEV
ncbi:uncharacterized protein [Paramormyrops kingsleyae]|uniref:uncharacterized protein n=1 Tax=Paramormyrops kingsleyae TaxID=1676925 RepID=UPI003B96F34C